MGTADHLSPVHPGEVLLDDYLKPMELSRNRSILSIGVLPRRFNDIVLSQHGLIANTALRLVKFFSTSPDVWLVLQQGFEFDVVMEESGDWIEREGRTYDSIQT